MDFLNNSLILATWLLNSETYALPIVIWNSTLWYWAGVYLKYYHMMLYSDVHISDQQVNEWNTTVLFPYSANDCGSIPSESQVSYTYHESLLFILMADLHHWETNDLTVPVNVTLEILNVETLHFKSIVAPFTLISSDYDFESGSLKGCMVSDGDGVYIIKGEFIYLYDLLNETWRVNEVVEVDTAACAVYQKQSIYLFALHSYGVFRYGITDNYIIKVKDTTNLCFAQRAKAIFHRNGKLYLHGCALVPWVTLIFDLEKEQFEDNYIGISNVSPTYTGYYRLGQLVSLDDNILMMLYNKGKEYPSFPFLSGVREPESSTLYYAITDMISINFEQTELFEPIWPSDGFYLRYYVNDFSNVSDTYNLWIFSNNINHNINTSILLNVSEDECICGEPYYKCFDCMMHFDLQQHLSIIDNDIYTLEFGVEPHYFETNISLILPDTITINLQRCNIRFDEINMMPTYKNKSIVFGYNISQNCLSRNGSIFWVNINSSTLNIKKIMKIMVREDNSSIYICDAMSTNCDICMTYQCKIEFSNVEDAVDILDSDESLVFELEFISNMTDLVISSQQVFSGTFERNRNIMEPIAIAFLCCLHYHNINNCGMSLLPSSTKQESAINIHIPLETPWLFLLILVNMKKMGHI